MASKQTSAWQNASEKVAAMSLRERVILAVTCLTLVVFVWLQFFFWPIEDQNQKNTNQLATTNSEIAEQAERLAKLEAELANNPNTPLREEQARLESEMQELKQRIESRLSILIPPEQMADLIRSVLEDYKGLKLLRAQNLPVQPIRIGGQQAENSQTKGRNSRKVEAPPNDEQAVFYSHGFEMVFTGSYFQAMQFLQKLEQYDGFFWTRFDYQVKDYPSAEITIQINTLSLEEDWIGV